MIDSIGDYGKHVTLPGRASPKLASCAHMNPFLPSGNRRAEIFFRIVDVKRIEIDNLRPIGLGNSQELSFVNDKGFPCGLWDNELFDQPH
jgi:hypothetical protein